MNDWYNHSLYAKQYNREPGVDIIDKQHSEKQHMKWIKSSSKGVFLVYLIVHLVGRTKLVQLVCHYAVAWQHKHCFIHLPIGVCLCVPLTCCIVNSFLVSHIKKNNLMVAAFACVIGYHENVCLWSHSSFSVPLVHFLHHYLHLHNSKCIFKNNYYKLQTLVDKLIKCNSMSHSQNGYFIL